MRLRQNGGFLIKNAYQAAPLQIAKVKSVSSKELQTLPAKFKKLKGTCPSCLLHGSSTYNLCEKSWNTYGISGYHLVASPSPPQNNVDVYSVDRYRNSRNACRHFSDKKTLNSTLRLRGGDSNRARWIKIEFL